MAYERIYVPTTSILQLPIIQTCIYVPTNIVYTLESPSPLLSPHFQGSFAITRKTADHGIPAHFMSSSSSMPPTTSHKNCCQSSRSRGVRGLVGGCWEQQPDFNSFEE